MTTVEPGTTDDLDALTDMWTALVADQRTHGTHLLAAENRTAARGVLSQRAAADQILVARDDGITGFVTYYVEDGFYSQDATRGVVENVYVAEPHRNEGVGSRLLEAAEAELRERGADVIAVAAMADNERARRLYEERGYAPYRVTYEKPVGSDNHTNEEG